LVQNSLENYLDDYKYMDIPHPDDPNRSSLRDLTTKMESALSNPKRNTTVNNYKYMTDKDLRIIR